MNSIGELNTFCLVGVIQDKTGFYARYKYATVEMTVPITRDQFHNLKLHHELPVPNKTE